MTTVFEGTPKFGGISGDYVRVMAIKARVREYQEDAQ